MNPNSIEFTAARPSGSTQRPSPPPARRSNGVRTLAGAASLALAIGFSLAGATPAVAAPVPVSDPGDIVSAFGTGGEITLQNTIIVNQSLTLAAGIELTIDLAGHTLEVRGTSGSGGSAGAGGSGAGGDGADGGNGGAAITNNGTLIVENGTFSLRGGDGGPGGAGAGGAAGADGTDGPGPWEGGVGGTGGDGGSGGTAGDGGTGLVNSGVFLISVTTASEIHGGAGGSGGNGGPGGVGGTGGDEVLAGDGGFGGNGGEGGSAGNGGNGGFGLSNAGFVLASGGLAQAGGAPGAGGSGGNGGTGGDGGFSSPGLPDAPDGSPGSAGLDGASGTPGNASELPNDSVTLDGNHADATPSEFFVLAPTGATLGDIEPSLTTLAWPSIAGQTLTGWFTTATGGTQADAATLLSAQPTLYAQWAATASAPDSTLADTGASFGPWPWIAGLCMFIGLGLIVVTRPALARTSVRR